MVMTGERKLYVCHDHHMKKAKKTLEQKALGNVNGCCLGVNFEYLVFVSLSFL